MGIRRKAREFVLQYLYQQELKGKLDKADLDLFWKNADANDQTIDFANQIIDLVISNLADIDELLKKNSKNWKLSRMSGVDRNILRLSVAEIIFRSDIPEMVSMNEAIEIAKKFGSNDSASFINGILDNIAKHKN